MTTPLVAIGLAVYGWWLIHRLAKSREAYDLYGSVITLLEELLNDGENAWQTNPPQLDSHTELKLTAKLAAVEQRLGLIQKHYHAMPSPEQQTIEKEIAELRKNLTISQDQVRQEEPRETAILRLTTTIATKLLEESYRYIADGRRQWRYAAWIVGTIIVTALALSLELLPLPQILLESNS